MSGVRHLIREYGETMRRLGRMDDLRERLGDPPKDMKYEHLEKLAASLQQQILAECRAVEQ